MRKTAKALVLVLISFLGTVALGIASALSAALAFGATALIVPGTGTPNANIVDNYMEQARDRYLTTTACGPTGAACPDANLQGINYPASFFPLIIFPSWCRSGPDGCDKWDESVGQGTTALNAAIDAALNDPDKPGQDVVVFGYSQGGAVVANSLAEHIAGLSDADKARLQIVTIGGIQTPAGGLWPRLAGFGFIPFLDISFTPPMTPGTGVNYTSTAFHFDPVADAPLYWGNPFAMLNAIAAFETVHGYYLSPNGNGPTDTLPYGYTDETLADALDCSANPGNCRYDSDGNTYITIPALTLPIADLILSSTPAALLPLVKPFVDLASPVYRVLADLGYDYSGDPSVPTPLSILPFNPIQNWFGVGLNLVAAAGQGVQAFLGDLGGGSMMLAPATTTPTPTPLLAGRSLAPQAAAVPVEEPSSSKVTALSLVEKSEPEAAPAAKVAEPAASEAPSTPAEPAVTKTEEPAAAEPSKPAEATAVDEKKADEPKKDETTKDETTKDEAKDEAKKADEPKKEEPKKDESEKKADSADTQKAAA
ncbi:MULTISPECIES: PE-PPE domain-containing protein [unclassified Mycobacterium]|uniref:PE-PPE domain-containing protein n=1 Tax=unclassified Mycobacterium TaxID=2642494 RepID=UPI0029C7331F|nr:MULTISPECIES: PE-PPE domain-containing protein [unclassified Mycobacterium]